MHSLGSTTLTNLSFAHGCVGAFAIYLEPWHADVFDWLELRKNHGKVIVNFGFGRSSVF